MLWPTLKFALAPVLAAQAVATRRRAPLLPEAAGPRQAPAGDGALRLLIAGDSSAAGVGVERQERALAGHLVRTLRAESGREVAWQLVARSGLNTAGVLALLRESDALPAEVAVVVSGVNDLIDRVPPARAVQQRAALADWLLHERGVRHVVFAPLPPVHRFPLLPRPLRDVAGAEARRHDRALARWAATRADVSHVAIPLELGVEAMASDGFHPGEPVYLACGQALARHLLAHVLPGLDDRQGIHRRLR